LELETILKTDEFKKAIREIVREQMSQTYQDMDEIRRSPAGSIIRIEEEIKSIKQNMVTKEEFKSSFMRLESRIEGIEGRFGGLEGRFGGIEGEIDGLKKKLGGIESKFGVIEGKFGEIDGKFGGIDGKFEGLEGRLKGLEGKINLITGLIFVMLTIYGALIVKLIFFP